MAKIAKRRGRYVVDFYDAAKRRRWKSFTHRKDAEAFLVEVVREGRLARTGLKVHKKARFEHYAWKWWENHRPNLKPSTAEHYRLYLKNHLLPRFGHMDLAAIDREAIQRLKADMTAQGKWKAQTVNHVLKTLKKLLNDAVLDGYLESSPALSVKPVPMPQREMDFLNPDELRLLLDHASSRYRPLFLCAMLTGLRRGELLALQWGDMDFANGQIWVRRSLYQGKFIEPKSERSRRRVDIRPMLAETLKALPSRFRGGLVFCQDNGKPLDPNNLVKREFDRALRRAGLRHVSFHSLRHSYTALLIEAEQNAKYIQHQLGHASIKTTMDRYGHLLKATNPEASRRLQGVFLRENGSKMVAEKAMGK